MDTILAKAIPWPWCCCRSESEVPTPSRKKKIWVNQGAVGQSWLKCIEINIYKGFILVVVYHRLPCISSYSQACRSSSSSSWAASYHLKQSLVIIGHDGTFIIDLPPPPLPIIIIMGSIVIMSPKENIINDHKR